MILEHVMLFSLECCTSSHNDVLKSQDGPVWLYPPKKDKMNIARMIMLKWICSKSRKNKMWNGYTWEAVECAQIWNKMMENLLNWYKHMQ